MKGADVIQPSSVEFALEDPNSKLSKQLLHNYYDELVSILPDDFDVNRMVPSPAEELKAPNGALLVAWIDGRPVGCGAVRKLDDATGEVKRMWISPEVRGQGVGKRLLIALEGVASDLGCRRARLDTSSFLAEALALYRSCGYEEIAAYNDNPYATFWGEKWLTPNN
jgi:GNAT superfamily N-acetyltransferase